MTDTKDLLAQASVALDAERAASAQALDSLTAANVALQAQLDTAQATIAALQAKLDVPAGYRAVPAGASMDAIQAELDKGGNIYLPAGRYSVDAVKSLRLRSNTSLLLHKDAELVALPNSADGYNVMLIERVDNVQVCGGRILGERASHAGTTGEGGMGIRIRGATNVTVTNVECRDFWGDGVVVGPWKGASYIVSKNVTLKGVVCAGNRRNGMSVGNVVGFLAEDCEVSNNGNDPDGAGPIIGGTSPFCGVDVEPDPDPAVSVAGEAHDIVFRRLKASGNHTHGVNVYKRVYNIRFEDCDLSGNGSVGLKAIEAHGIALAGNRVTGNETAGVQIGAGNDKVNVTGNTFGQNGGMQARLTTIVKDGIVSTRDLSVGATDKVIGVNTYE